MDDPTRQWSRSSAILKCKIEETSGGIFSFVAARLRDPPYHILASRSGPHIFLQGSRRWDYPSLSLSLSIESVRYL